MNKRSAQQYARQRNPRKFHNNSLSDILSGWRRVRYFHTFCQRFSGCLSQVKSVIAALSQSNDLLLTETLLFWRPLNSEGNSMRVGITLPCRHFHYGNIIFGMVLLAVTPRREHNHEENNDGVDGHRALIAVAGTELGTVVNSF